MNHNHPQIPFKKTTNGAKIKSNECQMSLNLPPKDGCCV